MTVEKLFMLDVDGVMTDGGFYYSKSGKVIKRFGPDDSDALKRLNQKIKIVFVSADEKGFKITKRRIKIDLGFDLYLLESSNRISWAKNKFPNHQIIYMGDSFTDVSNLQQSNFGISTRNSNVLAKQNAKFITYSNSGNRAVMEACIFLNHKLKLEADLPKWPDYKKAMFNNSN
jgi:3-deoxy-D-manno-octulosonate 8-phosphate phosphatase (KDO 8-P phosphatase)